MAARWPRCSYPQDGSREDLEARPSLSRVLCLAIGYAAAGASGSLLCLCVALALSGSGSSTQYPLASSAVSRAYGRDARRPLGSYNFSGDLGKAALPAAISLLVTIMPWRHALWTMSALGAWAAEVRICVDVSER